MFASTKPLSGILAACDTDQAAIVKDSVSRIIASNPWLKDYISVQAAAIVNEHTGSVCKVISSDAPSSYGALPSFVIYDEVAHAAKRDLFDSLLSAAAKKGSCLFAVITNAGFQDSWVWTVREAVRNDPAWYFSRLDGPKAKWITPDRLAEQRRLLPDVTYRRLWLNEWSGGSGDAVFPADLLAALTMRGPMLASEPGWAFVSGLDLSVSRDATALVTLAVNVGWTETKPVPQRKVSSMNRVLLDAGLIERCRSDEQPETIVHPGTGRVRLADVRLWQPSNGSRVDLSDVEAAILETDKRYGLSACAADPFQAELLCQRLSRAGLPIYTLQQTGITLQAQATVVLESFRARIVDLYPHDELLADLQGLQIAERAYGFRLISPRATRMDTHSTAHGDTATAFSVALLAAKRAALRPSREVPGRLVCYPSAVA
jgi:phage terminase large subunit-like protein